MQTQYFSDMQDPAKARLILVLGEGMEGLSYHLKADQHIVGRNGQVEFPDDYFVSPTHANFFYRNDRLVVKDEGSLNGVYVRFRGTTPIAPGDTFMAGDHVFRLELAPRLSVSADSEGTLYYASPERPSTFRITQIFGGGAAGLTTCSQGPSLSIGREGCELNFGDDVHLDVAHCTVEEREGRFYLTDHNSRNGTYTRIKTEVELGHGDYVFVGRKLLRVEINA
jgi:pSer/pThr/pTyr-binding forkhead associated (FHA) protein